MDDKLVVHRPYSVLCIHMIALLLTAESDQTTTLSLSHSSLIHLDAFSNKEISRDELAVTGRSETVRTLLDLGERCIC